LTQDLGDVVNRRLAARFLAELADVPGAMLSVSSSLEDGILAFAILACRTLSPVAIPGKYFRGS